MTPPLTAWHHHRPPHWFLKEEKEEKKQLKLDVDSEEVVDGTDYSWYWSWLTRRRKKKKRKKKALISKGPTIAVPAPAAGSSSATDEAEIDISTKGVLLANGAMGYYRKSGRPTSEMLSKLPLRKGANNITFTVSSTLQGTQSVNACIFLWDSTDKIVISDVDGIYIFIFIFVVENMYIFGSEHIPRTIQILKILMISHVSRD